VQYRLGDALTVKVMSANLESAQVDFALVRETTEAGLSTPPTHTAKREQQKHGHRGGNNNHKQAGQGGHGRTRHGRHAGASAEAIKPAASAPRRKPVGQRVEPVVEQPVMPPAAALPKSPAGRRKPPAAPARQQEPVAAEASVVKPAPVRRRKPAAVSDVPPAVSAATPAPSRARNKPAATGEATVPAAPRSRRRTVNKKTGEE